MRERIRYRFGLLKLELDESYRSFSISALIAIIFIAYSLLLSSVLVNIQIGFTSEGATHLPKTEFFTNLMNRIAINVVSTSMSVMNYLLISIIPLMISITFAGSFENGMMRNLLSLPLTRKSLLYTKFTIVFSVVGMPTLLGLLLGIYWFVPNSNFHIINLFLSISQLLVIFLAISISMLVAILTKSMMKCTFLSLAICNVLFLISYSDIIPIHLLGIINPIHATNAYLGGVSDIFGAILGPDLLLLSMEACFILCLSLLSLSVIRFGMIEVE